MLPLDGVSIVMPLYELHEDLIIYENCGHIQRVLVRRVNVYTKTIL